MKNITSINYFIIIQLCSDFSDIERQLVHKVPQKHIIREILRISLLLVIFVNQNILEVAILRV